MLVTPKSGKITVAAACLDFISYIIPIGYLYPFYSLESSFESSVFIEKEGTLDFSHAIIVFLTPGCSETFLVRVK